MLLVEKTLTLAPTTDADYIAAAQTPAGAGYLTLNGIGASTVSNTLMGTSYTRCLLDTNGNVRQVSFTTVANESGKTLRVEGRLVPSGPIVSETITGPNTTTGTTTNYFYEITGIYASAAFSNTVTAGVNAVGATLPIVLDHFQNPFQVNQAATIVSTSGTPNITAQRTLADVMDMEMTTTLPAWVADAEIVGETAAATVESKLDGNICFAVRLVNNSGTGTSYYRVMQAGPG